MSLHNLLMNTPLDGWDGFEESPNFPEGITSSIVAERMKSTTHACCMYVPAGLVKDSETSRRILAARRDLDQYYIVYRAFRRGAGHDSSYG